MRRIHDLVVAGSQFLIATHSPVLLALPGARIIAIDPGGKLEQVEYDEAEPVVFVFHGVHPCFNGRSPHCSTRSSPPAS